jgi:hypothetical protein
MNALPQRRAQQATAPSTAQVVVLAPVHILFAIAQRRRYKYVQPRVEREGPGWKIVSPNCSRNIDPGGGEIDIAWFVPANEGTWLLYARDHARACWVLKASGLALAAALATVGEDTRREYWP